MTTKRMTGILGKTTAVATTNNSHWRSVSLFDTTPVAFLLSSDNSQQDNYDFMPINNEHSYLEGLFPAGKGKYRQTG